jgi:hypothetical protein
MHLPIELYDKPSNKQIWIVSGLSCSMIKRVLFPPLDSFLESNFYLMYCSISYRRESGFNRIQFNRN